MGRTCREFISFQSTRLFGLVLNSHHCSIPVILFNSIRQFVKERKITHAMTMMMIFMFSRASSLL